MAEIVPYPSKSAEIVPYPKVPYYPTMTIPPAFIKHIREQWMSSKEKEKKNG